MLLRTPYYLMDAGSSQADESESLQADVMRFMAILGLCLMVIFALVQSLPSVPVDREAARDAAAQQAALMREINELRNQVSTLGFAIRQTESENSEATSVAVMSEQTMAEQAQKIIELESSVTQGEMLNRTLSQQLTELRQLLDEQSREATQRAQALDEQQALQRAQQLAELQANQREQELVEMQAAQQAREQADIQAAERAQELAALSQQAELQPAVSTNDSEKPVGAEEQTSDNTIESPPEEGFRLRFASDSAFFRQVSSGRIDVFAKTPSGGYKLDTSGQRLKSSELPKKFQEISANSLPLSLGRALSAVHASGSAQWGVVLSPAVLAAIQSAQAGAKGGLLVIQESGAVILK